MEKKISNLGLLSFTFVIIGLIVVTGSIMKMIDNHHEKMIYAMQSKVEYYAKRCYLEGKCKETTYLSDLYELGYLKEVVNPVTKEILDDTLEINYENDSVIINWDEI